MSCWLPSNCYKRRINQMFVILPCKVWYVLAYCFLLKVTPVPPVCHRDAKMWCHITVAGFFHLIHNMPLLAFIFFFILIWFFFSSIFLHSIRKQSVWWWTTTAARKQWSGWTLWYHCGLWYQSSVISVTLTPNMSSFWGTASVVVSYSWTSLWVTWRSRSSTYTIRA